MPLVKINKSLIEEISAFGALPFYLFLCFFVFLTGEVKLFFWLLSGVILSYILVIIIRLVYYKNRPNEETYSNLIEKLCASSFPSLHSIRITLIFCFFSYYFKSIYLMIFFACISLLVFYSRHYLKKHFLIDIFFGFLFGVVEAITIIWLFN